jgi:hypothetical protein
MDSPAARAMPARENWRERHFLTAEGYRPLMFRSATKTPRGVLEIAISGAGNREWVNAAEEYLREYDKYLDAVYAAGPNRPPQRPHDIDPSVWSVLADHNPYETWGRNVSRLAAIYANKHRLSPQDEVDLATETHRVIAQLPRYMAAVKEKRDQPDS